MRSGRRSGRTAKPCPGCGVVVQYRRADEICSNCKRDIEENKQRREREAELLTQQDQKLLQVPRGYYSLPSLSDASVRGAPHGEAPPELFRQAFFRLALLLGIPASKENHASELLVSGTELAYDTDGFLFASVVIEQLRALYAAVQACIKAAYTNGQEDIRNLFQRVVSGDIELNRFAKRMELDPEEITSRIVFASAPGAAPARLLLCEVGQVDAKGQAVTQERLDDIEKLYTGMGVAIERQGNQLWTKLKEEKKEGSQ